MKYIFGILMVFLLSIENQAKSIHNDPTGNAGIEIAPNVENNYLAIEVEQELSETVVTVSVFSSLGEIVLETVLRSGLNKINVQNLKAGEYVAVVRENGEYTSKRSFTVN